jgi:succinoglycan biosynthesis transport protein ExoP
MPDQYERLLPVPSNLPGRLLEGTSHSAPYPLPASIISEDSEFHKTISAILKRKWLILTLLVVATSVVALHVFSLPPIYEATATLRMNSRQNISIQAQGMSIDSFVETYEYYETQVKLLTNPQLMRQVVLKLDLQHDPDFLAKPAGLNPIETLRRLRGGSKPSQPAQRQQPVIPVSGDAIEAADALTPAQMAEMEPLVNELLANLKVERQGQTNLVTIRFTHSKPETAMRVTDAITRLFVMNDSKYETQGAQASAESLSRQIADIQTTLKQQEDERLNYLKSHNLPIVEQKGQNLTSERVQTLSSQLLAAEADRKNLESISTAAQSATDVWSVPQVLENQQIQGIQKDLRQLEQKRAALLEIYTADWPEVKQLTSQIETLRQERETLARATISSLKSNLAAAIDRESKLRESYFKENGIASQQSQDAMELDNLNRQIETNKQIYTLLFQRQKELEINAIGKSGSHLSIVTPSALPLAPIGPPRGQPIALAAVFSLIAGMALAYLLNLLDTTLRSAEDISDFLGLSTLAIVPSYGRRFALRGAKTLQGQSQTALELSKNVRSPTAEAYRNLRTSLLFTSTGNAPKCILLTSGHPLEGKTTTAVNLAIAFAHTGEEVLIIDCDLRRPRVHDHFNLPNKHGLTNCLSGEMKLEELLHSHGDQPNLKILSAGPTPPNPADFLGSTEMRNLLAEFRSRFAYIIIDSPPAASLADAPILSTLADSVLIVAHSHRSSRYTARRIKQRMESLGAHIVGVVLNDVSVKAQDYYYYGPEEGSMGIASDAGNPAAAT